MQIFKEILGNIKNLKDASQIHSEKVFLNSEDLLKKSIVAVTDHGTEIGINIADGTKLSEGDILFQSNDNIIYVSLLAEDVIEIEPIDLNQMGMVAHNLGNRHTPAQFEDNKMYVPYDYLIEEFLIANKVKYARKQIKLKQAFRHCDNAK